jgi:hypothetical protein
LHWSKYLVAYFGPGFYYLPIDKKHKKRIEPNEIRLGRINPVANLLDFLRHIKWLDLLSTPAAYDDLEDVDYDINYAPMEIDYYVPHNPYAYGPSMSPPVSPPLKKKK